MAVIQNQGYHAFLHYNSLRKSLNLLLAELQKALRCSHLYAFPYKMILDTNNVCNLKCSHCPTGRGVPGRPKGFMAFDSFKQIIDEIGRYLYIIDLFNWGEPLLHGEIYNMIQYAEARNICTNIHSNFNIDFGKDTAERMIMSGLSYLTVSLDGADQAVYTMYRRNGNLQKALENAKCVIEKKKELKRQRPLVTWQFLVFPHNRHQIDFARQMAREMGFDSFRVLAGVTSETLSALTEKPKGEISPLEDLRKRTCHWLWTTATFHWDGGVGPCCLQFKKEEDFGVLTNSSFLQIWNNPKFIHARSLFGHWRKRIDRSEELICAGCFKVRRKSEKKL